MRPITICFTYFRSLSLANLEAALYSVSKQDLSQVESIVIVDNNTEDPLDTVWAVVNSVPFGAPINLHSFKHGDASKTHSWSSNLAVSKAFTPWILFTRADYILDFDVVQQFYDVAASHPADWDGFITGNVYHLGVDIGACAATGWRQRPGALRNLPGIEEDYTRIDSGVWMARRRSFDRVGGLDEALTLWGHAQTHFQHKLAMSGTEFVRIPRAMFYHPQHSAERDISLAHKQLADIGVDLKAMWARHEGAQPY